MKTFIFNAALILSVLQLLSCGDRFSDRYVLVMPQVPEAWSFLLGEPHWRLEWLDSGGQTWKTDVPPGKVFTLELPVTWINPVTAWPFWPEFNLIPGHFRPAGALFPYDTSVNNLNLSWKAGIDTVFYRELVYANANNMKKIPANFDWQRFRELFLAENINEEVKKDPWIVNWQYVAEKTIDSNFDRRRLVPEKTEKMEIQVPPGIWYGNSPFAEPLYFEEGETPVFQIRPGLNLWISSEGILRCNGKTWILTKID
jgi:hypothetical protein